MKYVTVIFCCLLNLLAAAQVEKNKATPNSLAQGKKYFSFNPFGLAEPQMAIGAGFSNRFTSRSEYFTEVSYIAKTPFYSYQASSLSGFRFLSQYRYHFLPASMRTKNTDLKKERMANAERFVGLEFRLKMYAFSGTNTFVNKTTQDTLRSVAYKANAVSLGGAVVFGNTYNISKNQKWKIEITAGIGVKHKIVNIKDELKGYEIVIQRKPDGLAPPYIFEAVGMPYIPCTIRLKYLIN